MLLIMGLYGEIGLKCVEIIEVRFFQKMQTALDFHS